MFSLIITIISIVLVAALALATLYYGGSAFNKGAAEAAAAKILLQGQQLLGASELYKADTGKWPPTMAALVASKHLKSLPVAYGPLGEAFAADRQWQMPSSGTPVFLLRDVNVATCQTLNKKAYGVDAVLKTARTDYLRQCFGLSTKALKVVVGKTSGDLLDAAADPAAGALLGTVLGQPAPADLASPEWLDLTGAGDVDTPDPVDPVDPVDPGPGLLPLASFSTLYLDFGEVATNTTETRRVMLSNPGTGVLVLTAAPGLSADSAEAFTPLITECGDSLAVNASCVTVVSFSPTAVGAVTGTLSFETNAAGSPAEVELHAIAYNPVLLAAAVLPTAKLNKAYPPLDFASLLGVSNETTPDKSLASWSKDGSLPAGLSLSSTGVLSGTPTALNPGAAFTVLATYKLNQSQQAYTLKVGEAVLDALQVIAGGSHTCAITLTGGLKCWGYNARGQLGDNSIINKKEPVDTGLAGVTRVVLGSEHTCAIAAGDTVWCWGGNGSGQLGIGTTVPKLTPTQIPGLTALRVAAGGAFSCAITRVGALNCWGTNQNGELGTGVGSYSLSPAAVPGLLAGVDEVSANGSSACAVTTAGAAKCWGYNGAGEAGTGTTDIQRTPFNVPGLSTGVAKMLTGSQHNCALLTNGGLKCLGANYYGQLGNGSRTSSLVLVDVIGLTSGVTNFSLGNAFGCATQAGGLKCWGDDGWDQLGNGSSTETYQATPVQVTGLGSGVTGISAAGLHACALQNGLVKCWGRNAFGQLGDGTTTQRAVPVSVSD